MNRSETLLLASPAVRKTVLAGMLTFLGLALVIFGERLVRATGIMYFVCFIVLTLEGRLFAWLSRAEAALQRITVPIGAALYRNGAGILFILGLSFAGYSFLLEHLAWTYFCVGMVLSGYSLLAHAANVRWFGDAPSVIAMRIVLAFQALVAIAAIGYVAFVVATQGINVPIIDEYKVIVQPLTEFDAATWREKWSLLTSPHMEHRLVTYRLAALFDWKLFGRVNFHRLMFVGLATFLATPVLLYRVFCPRSNKALIFMPVLPFLFQFQLHHMYLAGLSIPNMLVVVSVLATLYAINKSGPLCTTVAMIAAVVATFSHASGLLAFFLGLAMLLLARRWIAAAAWLAPMSLCIAAYFAHSPMSGLGEIYPNNYVGPIHKLDFLFATIGAPSAFGLFSNFEDFSSMGDLIDSSPALLHLLFAIGAFVLASIVGLIFAQHYRRNPVLFGFLMYLLASMLLIVQGRSFGLFTRGRPWAFLYFALQSRYTQWSVLTIAVIYLAYAELFPRISLRTVLPATLAACAFNVLSWQHSWPILRMHQANILLGLYLDTALHDTDWPKRTPEVNPSFLYRDPQDWIRRLDGAYQPPRSVLVARLSEHPARINLSNAVAGESSARITRVSDNNELVEVAAAIPQDISAHESSVYGLFTQGDRRIPFALRPLRHFYVQEEFMVHTLPPESTHLGYIAKSDLGTGRYSVAIAVDRSHGISFSESKYSVPCLTPAEPRLPGAYGPDATHLVAQRNYCEDPTYGTLRGLESTPSFHTTLGDAFTIALLYEQNASLAPELLEFTPDRNEDTSFVIGLQGNEVRVDAPSSSTGQANLAVLQLAPTAWNLVVLTVDHDALHLYRGNLNRSKCVEADAQTVSRLSQSATFGGGTVRLSKGDGAPQLGRLAEVRITPGGLSPQEVDALWNEARANLHHQ